MWFTHIEGSWPWLGAKVIDILISGFIVIVSFLNHMNVCVCVCQLGLKYDLNAGRCRMCCWRNLQVYLTFDVMVKILFEI